MNKLGQTLRLAGGRLEAVAACAILIVVMALLVKYRERPVSERSVDVDARVDTTRVEGNVGQDLIRAH